MKRPSLGKLQHRNYLSLPVHTFNTPPPENLSRRPVAAIPITQGPESRALEHIRHDRGCGGFRPFGRICCPVVAQPSGRSAAKEYRCREEGTRYAPLAGGSRPPSALRH